MARGSTPTRSWPRATIDLREDILTIQRSDLAGGQGTWTTDADGRFEVRGVGRDRIVGLEFRSPDAGRKRPSTRWPAGQDASHSRARGRPAGGKMMIGQPSAPPLCRRDVRAHRRPDQADHGRRPVEGDGPAVGGRPCPAAGSRRPGRRSRPDRRRGPLPPRRPAQGRGLQGPRCPQAGNRSVPRRAASPYRHRGAEADRDGTRAAQGRHRHRPPDRHGDGPAGPGQACQPRQAADQPQRRPGRSEPQWPRRPDLPDHRPTRRGDALCQRPRGESPLRTARLRKADKGKGIGGIRDGEA